MGEFFVFFFFLEVETTTSVEREREKKVERAEIEPMAAAPGQPICEDVSRSDHSAGSREMKEELASKASVSFFLFFFLVYAGK